MKENEILSKLKDLEARIEKKTRIDLPSVVYIIAGVAVVLAIGKLASFL